MLQEFVNPIFKSFILFYQNLNYMKKIFTSIVLISIASCNTNTSQGDNATTHGVKTLDNVYNLLTDQSSITWKGRELSTKVHYGTLNFVSGEFEVVDGLISNGEFVVDMTSINDQDMKGDRKARLEGHLKSDDFFSVETYQTATLSIASSKIISDGKWNVFGELTIKTYTHPVSFEMIRSEEGWSASLFFDRSKYDVKFRSGTFFQNLGDKLIYDDIELVISLKTV